MSLSRCCHPRHDDQADDVDREMSLRLRQCLPHLLGASPSPSQLLVLLTVLVTLPASLNDQSKHNIFIIYVSNMTYL